MKERPVIFSGEMVRAILAGTKTQTRRVVRIPSRGAFAVADHGDGWWPFESDDGESILCHDGMERMMSCPYGQVGDRLWVKETYAFSRVFDSIAPSALAPEFRHEPVWYAADGVEEESWMNRGRWRPSIHMPRWASRLTLEVTGVRVERLQDISEDDARAEGVDWAAPIFLPGDDDGYDDREDPREVGYSSGSFARQNFTRLWDRINGERAPWDSNPWVWVIKFRRVP